jgi:hypothetical protein
LDLLRDPMRGVLTNQAAILATIPGQRCLTLPVEPAEDRLQSPHGEILVSTACDVVSYLNVDGMASAGWRTAVYRWTSVFTAEDSARDPNARDRVTEEEVVVLEATGAEQVQPVWPTMALQARGARSPPKSPKSAVAERCSA